MIDPTDPEWLAERSAAHRDLLLRMGAVASAMLALALAVTYALSRTHG